MFEWNVFLPISGVEVNGFALILLGFTVGVIGGFFGIGGAFMVTPALNVLGFPMAYAIGTDMAHIAGKSIVATAKHKKLGHVDIKLGVLMILGTAIGIELGATLIMWLEKIGRIGPVVRIVYIFLLLGLGLYMLYEYFTITRRPLKREAREGDSSQIALFFQRLKIPPMIDLKVSGLYMSLWVIVGVGVVTGFVAGFLGVGGGFIRMPALLYIIGTPTKVAVGTDLFEVMFSGAYGAFTYALKGRVELVAAIIMLLGAAVGAQIGATATKYARGMVIRLYFAITMLLAAVSVVFKHLAENNRAIYEKDLLAWAKSVSGLTEKAQLSHWLYLNKEAVKSWILQQPEHIQKAYLAYKMWSDYSGYLMFGAACSLSLIIMFFLVRGVLRERIERRFKEIVVAPRPKREVMLAVSCVPTDLPAIKLGAQVAKAFSDEVTVFVCEEEGVCQTYIEEGLEVFKKHGLKPNFEFAKGIPYKEILKRAKDSDLLVIGSRPLDPLKPQFYLGDNATQIVKHMTTNTLVVRGKDEVRKILLYTDLPYSEKVIDITKRIALATDSSVEILYVASLPTMYPTEVPHIETSDLKDLLYLLYREEIEILEELRKNLIEGGVKEVQIKLREGIVEEEIIKESIEGDFDLIILREGYLRSPFGLLLERLSVSVATHSPYASVLIVKR